MHVVYCVAEIKEKGVADMTIYRSGWCRVRENNVREGCGAPDSKEIEEKEKREGRTGAK